MGMAKNTRERGREQAGMTREGRRTMEKVLENTVRDNPVEVVGNGGDASRLVVLGVQQSI